MQLSNYSLEVRRYFTVDEGEGDFEPYCWGTAVGVEDEPVVATGRGKGTKVWRVEDYEFSGIEKGES